VGNHTAIDYEARPPFPPASPRNFYHCKVSGQPYKIHLEIAARNSWLKFINQPCEFADTSYGIGMLISPMVPMAPKKHNSFF
jgi:hypothetical protein